MEPASSNRCGSYSHKMKTQQNRKERKGFWKNELSNILLSLGVSLIALFSFTYFNPSIPEMFATVIFILTLLLLKIPNKK